MKSDLHHSSVWAVARTKPNRERLAVTNLERQGFEVYFPFIFKQTHRRGQYVLTKRPLFPNYVLVRTDPRIQNWRPILSTFGVSTLLRFGNEPGIVPHAFVETMKAREDDGVIALPAQPFKEGQEVEITRGPFQGVVAKILTADGPERLTLLVEVMQREVKTIVASGHVADIG